MVFDITSMFLIAVNAVAVTFATYSTYILFSESKNWSGGFGKTLLYLSFSSICFLSYGVVMSIFQYFIPSDRPTLLVLPQAFFFMGFVFTFIGIYKLRKFFSLFTRVK